MKKAKKLIFNSNVWMAVISVFFLAAMFLPLVYIAQYIWPCSDDFEMSLWSKMAFDATGSVFQTVIKALEYALDYWKKYEGTFSSLFLMALQPGIWGDQYYGIGVAVLVVGLVLCTFTLTYVLIVKCARAPKSIWLILTAVPMMAWFMWIVSTEEAFFWWTGASNYVGFHSWVMLMIAVVIGIYRDYDSYSGLKRKLLYLLCFGCFFLGGGNYLSALLLVLVLLGVLAAAIYGRRANRCILACLFVSAMTALLLSVFAPGNSFHMIRDVETDISVLDAICISIRDGIYDIYAWTHIPQFLLFAMVIPFVWTLARGSGCKFRLPLVATILSGGLFLAEYAPISYSYGGFEPGRIINLYYWNYYWLVMFNLFYWIGWIDRKVKERKGKVREYLVQKQNCWQAFYVLVAAVLFVSCLGIRGLRETNPGWVYAELIKGRYRMTDEFMADRIAYFEQHQGEDVVVEEIPYKSVITYFDDLFPDTDHLVNRTMAEYYGVKSITLK